MATVTPYLRPNRLSIQLGLISFGLIHQAATTAAQAPSKGFFIPSALKGTADSCESKSQSRLRRFDFDLDDVVRWDGIQRFAAGGFDWL
jgi:hypothetical protein